jgi:hypothetical protein
MKNVLGISEVGVQQASIPTRLSLGCGLCLCIMAITAWAEESPTVDTPVSVIYVDEHATGENNGSSWSAAYTSLQDALIDANHFAKPVEIRVAQGTYRPDRGVGLKRGDRNATFKILNGVAIKGGYAGATAPDPNTRDISRYKSILSGDLEADDPCWFDWSAISQYYPMWWNNSLHVVTATKTDESAVLNGLEIVSGNSTESVAEEEPGFLKVSGGGVVIQASRPTLIDCTFIGNAAGRGGAIVMFAGSEATFTNCEFANNCGYSGSAISLLDGVLTLIKCRFLHNTGGDGAGLNCARGSLSATGCQFIGNAASFQGGGISCDKESRIVLEGCAFTTNSSQYGGALATPLSEPRYTPPINVITAVNCIFSGNTATKGGGTVYGSVALTNCTLTGNRSFSIMRGPIQYEGVDCIFWQNLDHPPSENIPSQDPLFAKAGYWADPNDPNVSCDPNDLKAIWIDGDYHLKSQAGRWDPVRREWVQDDVTSPCIDAGDPNRPVGDEPLPNGGIINLGAYGGTKEASKSRSEETL